MAALANLGGAPAALPHSCRRAHGRTQIFSDPQLRPFFDGISEQTLRHKQETMMEMLFGGAVSGARETAADWCMVQPCNSVLWSLHSEAAGAGWQQGGATA